MGLSRSRGHLWLLLAITLLGGVVRFATINSPPIWGDEAHTFGRISGNFPYRDLLDILQYDGFTPLHYELYWSIKQLPLSESSAAVFLPLLGAALAAAGAGVLAGWPVLIVAA